ncbi:MAG: hypothetical protein HY922_08830 [Elusimicrobia bacterium]|nr:hypothetical protein [Elusimicrobiota bacterium]
MKGAPAGAPAAGNFTDLDTVTGDAPNTANQGRGHNLGATAALTPAGGDAAITGFNCTSCHDPHGVSATGGGIAAYRNLKLTPTGSGTTAGGVPADILALPAQGTLASAVFPITANSYGTAASGVSNFSKWCGTCHDSFYGSANTNAASPYIRHPTDKSMGAGMFANYDDQLEADRYPAEDTATSATANSGNANNKSAGNEANDGVFCISCHKPHASANKDSLRWAYETTGQGNSASVSGCGRCHNK